MADPSETSTFLEREGFVDKSSDAQEVDSSAPSDNSVSKAGAAYVYRLRPSLTPDPEVIPNADRRPAPFTCTEGWPLFVQVFSDRFIDLGS